LIPTLVFEPPSVAPYSNNSLTFAGSSKQTSQFTSPSGAIVGIVVGIAALLVRATVLFFVFRRRKKRHLHWQLQGIQSTRTKQSDETKSSLASSIARSSYRHSQISSKEIVIEKVLAEGSHGRVFSDRWKHACVALKFCRTKKGIDDFLREIQIFIELPPHPNGVQLFGVSIDGPEITLVLEYCEGGSLAQFFFETHPQLTEQQMISLARGIASGMLHLHQHNIVHRDLAARNILLTRVETGGPKFLISECRVLLRLKMWDRQIPLLDRCVGWLLNPSLIECIARKVTFGHTESFCMRLLHKPNHTKTWTSLKSRWQFETKD
jgi:serine/threonine protein kinase